MIFTSFLFFCRKEKVITKRSLRQGKSPSKNGRNSVKVVVNQHPKSPKSPASSLPHSPTKSPIRKSISVEESTIKEEVEEIEPEIPLPPPPSVVSPVKEERASEVKEVRCRGNILAPTVSMNCYNVKQ